MKAPSFWQIYPPTIMAKILTPFSYITQYITRQRLSKPAWKSSVPVICCGNLTVGGTGKTIVALELGNYFQQHYKIAFLTRGYKRKNQSPDPILVNSEFHTAHDVGDEAFLLSQLAPTYVASNRAHSAKLAIEHGAELLIMDDGFQNPTLYQDIPLLIIDGAVGFGNYKALPAGPLRENIQQGLKRAKACILIGKDQTNIQQYLSVNLPLFHASLKMDHAIHILAGQSVIAFAGIGRPEKFFHSLTYNNISIIHQISFPDHYHYQNKDIQYLLSLSQQHHIPLVTTYKDFVKLPHSFQQHVTPLGVHLHWNDPLALDRLSHLLHSKSAQDVRE